MPDPIATSTIASQAFRLMELSAISSFADDTPQARAAAEQYPIAMAMCLEAADWSFASVLAALPPATLDPGHAADEDLPFTYKLPGDCVRLIEVTDPDVKYRRDRDYLRADAPTSLTIRYTATPPDASKLPATFQTAVAFRLAALLAPKWIGAQTKITGLENGAERMLMAAMKQDARQASPARYDGRPEQPDWVSEATR